VFGLASVKDMDALRIAVNLGSHNNARMADYMHKQHNMLVSLINITKDRIDGLADALIAEQVNLQTTIQAFNAKTNLIMDWVVQLTAINAQQSRMLAELEQHFLQFSTAIQMLAQGHVTPYLVSNEEMRDTITLIEQRLLAHHNQYKLSQPISGSWYQLPAMLYTRVGNEIFVQIKFPITLRSAKYTMYEIHVYPLPVDNNSDHATKIVNIPRYLAINTQYMTFIEMTAQQYTTCTGGYRKTCNYIPAPVSNANPTCAVALYKDNIAQIHEKCDTRFQPNSLRTYAIEISDGEFLLSNVTQVLISCPRLNVKKLGGCKLCVLNLKCGCSLIAGAIQVFPRINQCERTKQPKIRHSMNLPLLLQFFNEQQIANISADTAFADVPNIILPSFEIMKQNTSNLIKADSEFRYKLKAIAKRARDMKPIKLIPTADIPPPNGFMDYDVTPSFWNIVSMALAVLNAVGLLLVFRKIKIIALALTLRPANGLDWKDTPDTAQTTTPDARYLSLFHNESHALVIATALLITLILIYALGRLLHHAYTTYKVSSSNESSILIEITDNVTSTRVNLLQVPSPPKNIIVKTTIWPQTVSIAGKTAISRKLFIDWNDLIFIIGKDQTQVRPHNLVPLTRIQSTELTTILQSAYSINMLVAFKGTSIYIPPCVTEIPSAPPQITYDDQRYPSILQTTRL
jgi:hypothetical protein